MKELKFKNSDLYFTLTIVFLLVISVFLAKIVLPFLLGMTFVYLVDPMIRWIQKKVPNRNLAASIFLLAFSIILVGGGFLFFFGVKAEIPRVQSAYQILAERTADDRDQAAAWTKGQLAKIYDLEQLESQIDTTSIIETLNSFIPSLGGSSNNPEIESENDSQKSFDFGVNGLLIFLGGIFYFFLLLFEFPEWTKKLKPIIERNSQNQFADALRSAEEIFSLYLRQRLKIAAIMAVLFVVGFLVIGIPGAIMLGLFIGVLAFVPYLHYFGLIPLSLGCLVLALENDQYFLVYFGIILGLFIMVSLIEEFLLVPLMIEKYFRLSPAVLVLSFSIWTYLLGMIGVLLAIPLTIFIQKYIELGLNPKGKE